MLQTGPPRLPLKLLLHETGGYSKLKLRSHSVLFVCFLLTRSLRSPEVRVSVALLSLSLTHAHTQSLCTSLALLPGVLQPRLLALLLLLPFRRLPPRDLQSFSDLNAPPSRAGSGLLLRNGPATFLSLSHTHTARGPAACSKCVCAAGMSRWKGSARQWRRG